MLLGLFALTCAAQGLSFAVSAQAGEVLPSGLHQRGPNWGLGLGADYEWPGFRSGTTLFFGGGGDWGTFALRADAAWLPLDGPWTPHAGNPIKRDAASARPGGRPFAIRDRFYRPAQDCSATYGGALHLMELLALTPTEFHERVALRLEPQRGWPYPDGLHHLVVDGTRVYFDAKRTHVDWLLWIKT